MRGWIPLWRFFNFQTQMKLRQCLFYRHVSCSAQGWFRSDIQFSMLGFWWGAGQAIYCEA